MAIRIQYASSPQTMAIASTSYTGSPLGSITEQPALYGGQVHKLVDAGGVAGDAVYYKSHASSYEVTPTIGNSSAGEIAGWLTTTAAANDIVYVQKKGIINAKASGTFIRGTPVWPDSGNNRVIPAGVFSGALGAAGLAAGDILGVANPCTGAWLVTSVIITTTTKSTGASTVDIGVAATAATSNDGLIDGIDLGTAVVTNANNFANAGTNGKASQAGAAGTVLTGSEASGDTTGLVGTYTGTFRPIGAGLVNLPQLGIAQAAASGGKVSMWANLPYLMIQRNQ